MIAVDTNVLVYAHRLESRHNERAFKLLRELVEDKAQWAIPWPCVFEFFSVVTNPRIWKGAASSPQQAWLQIRAWTDAPTNRLLAEVPEVMEVLGRLVTRPRVQGPIVHDARIAALCIAHGVDELLSADRDFALFPELPTRNPLVET